MTYGYSQTVALTSDQITSEISREISSFLDHQTRILEGIADDLLPVGASYWVQLAKRFLAEDSLR